MQVPKPHGKSGMVQDGEPAQQERPGVTPAASRWWMVPGFISGCLVAILAATLLLYGKTWIRYHPLPTPTRPTASPMATSDFEAEFERAEQALFEEGDYTTGTQILTALLPQLTAKSYLARAYGDLGRAEFTRGDFHRAAGYYLMLEQLEPSRERLLALAQSYDLAGDLEHAVEAYEELQDNPDFEGTQEQDVASQRLEQLYLVVGTPTPIRLPQ